MFAKLLAVLACLALSRAALVKREAPATTPLQDLQKHAEEFGKTFADQFGSLTSSKNTEEFNKVLSEGTASVSNQLSAFAASLQGALADANGKAKESLEAARATMERSAEELRRAHPDVEQRAAQLKDQLQAALQSALQETQKLAKDVAANVEQTNEKLTPKIQAAYNDLVKQAQDVQKKLHDAATKQ